MATLQDLFNEIQADSRISNPPTFEEFQSKMEDPAFAERVNEILGRNGYDVNAYEGLKKKEESMDESAPLSQQESKQPSETTETTQTVGTEPVEEVVSEEPQAETEDDLDPLNADLSAYNMEVKTPGFSNQNTPIQTAPQQQDVTQGSVMDESVNAPKPANQYKNNDIISLAKNAKNKFISKHIEPIFAQAKQATAQFDQEVKPSEETLSEVEDGGPGDPKRKDVKGAATSLYNEMDDLNHRTALRVLGDTRVLGVKMDGDNYEVVFTNNKMGGGDQGRSYKGVVGDVTWEGYVSNAVAKSDLYKDENAWEDLKSAVITQDTYSPELEGKKLTPSFNNNLAAHKSKYFPQGSVGQITGTVTIPKEKKGEDEASFGTDLKRFFEKVKVKVKTRDILNKDDEERKEYNIAEETIPKTEYVMDTEQTFYNSLNNSPETNAIMEANALNFSDILLPSSKNKETVMEGIKLFLAKAGYDENEINQRSGVIYKQMLRDARYHAAEQYIRHEIENGSKTYKFQDIDRLNQAKEKGVDELMGDESLVMQSDKNFVSNVWDISLSDYINHYDAKATVRGRNMDIKNIPGKVSAYTARMNELEAQIEAEKVKLQIPSKEQLSETVNGLKVTKEKVNAYDAQLSEIEQEINSLLVDQDGQKYFKDENSKAKYEALVAESERILKERNVLVEQSKAGSQDIEKVNQFQNNISRQLKEYEALRKKLNYYDDDPDLLAMRGLSNTLTSIQNYESDKLAGIKNDLYDFQDYREKVRKDDETARKEAEDDNVLEAGGKGLMGGFANALIGISKTGMYLGQVLTDEDSDQKEWTGGDELLAATSQLQENINQWASNPYYEKWGANWFFNAGAGAVPDLAAVYFTGGGAGFAELATTRGAIGALGKIAVSPTTVYFTIRSTGDYAEKLQKAGYSTGEAFLGGGIIAGTEAMLESLLPSFFNTTESISVKSFWKRTIEEGIAKKLAPEVIARQLKEGTIGIARNFGKSISVNTFNEKIEEGTQTLFTESAFAATTDETIQIFDPKTGGMGKTLEAVTESAAIGGTIGLVGSSAKGIRTLISEKANNTTLKLTQLQIGRKYTEIISEADKLSKDFKGSEVEKEYEKIKKEYDKLSSNPNFVKYDDVAQSEVLDKSLTLNELKEAQKNYESQNIVDVKLNNQITEKEKELASIINVAQKNTDAREEMNKQLEEIGVQSFTLNANGELNGITFDEFTTQDEQEDIIKKATDIIGKAYKPKPKENAVQKSSTGEVLQREPQETGEAGSQRKGVEPVLEGEGVTKEGGKEEIVATPKEAKEQEAMQNDIDQVQQSTGTVINLNEDGTLTINAPTRGGQSKKDAAIENAKQELANLGYNVESRVVPTAQQEVVQEEVQPEMTDEEFDNSIKEAESMGVVAGTQAMNDLQTRTAQDPKKGKIVAQASRAVKALKSLFPNMNIVLHENDESYNNAMGTLGGTANTRGQFVYKPTADGNIQGAVHINLDRANARTIAHEVTHAALLKMFKGDGKVFGNFKDKLKDIAKNQKMVITDKEGNQVETTWGDEAEKLSSRYQTEDQAEEYLSELAGLVAEMDTENPANKSILQKIAEFINKFILSNPQLNALGIKPITDTSSAEEVLEFFDTLGKKISRGEEIKTEYVNQNGEKLTSNDITYKLQNDFTDEKTGFSFEYLKNTEEFKKLEENGTITNDRELSDFNGDYVIAHQPDGAFSGDIYKTDSKTGEKYKVVDGKGGVFYPIKFNKQGYFWASTRDGAKKLTELLNDVYNKNGGKILMALTSAPKDKLLSSTLAANAVIDIFKSKQLDDNLKLSQADVKNALVKGAKSVIVKTDSNGKQKQVGLNLKTVNQKMTFEEIENLIREQLSPDNSSFGDRKVFVESFVSSLVDNIKTKRSEQELGEFFSKSIGNKGFKGEYASGYKLSKANVLQSISDMMLEPMLKNNDRNGSVYAMLETNSEVELVETDEHPSYPFAIKAKNNDVKVHILQDRLLWDENVLNSETGKPMTKEESLKVMPTTAGITFKPVIINSKGGVVAKSQMDDVQRTAQMYNMNEQGFFPKNADEFKINRDFEKFGLRAKRANATSWGPGSLYLVNQSGRKVNPFGVKRKAQIDIDAEESPLYQTRAKEDVPFVSNEQVRNDVPKMDATTRQTEAKGIKIEPGMLVGSRLNINASRSLKYPVLTIHYTYESGKTPKENPNASKGEAIGQRGNITLSNVNFNINQNERNKIAEGRAKGVMAMAVGRVTDSEPNFDGIELSFNPAREHLFVDSEGRAVKSAEEVTLMGYKAYARGKISYYEEFEDPRSPKYTAPSQVKFAKTKEELVKMADDVETGNTTVEEVGVPELAPEAVSEAINTFSDAIENGSTIEEATEEMEIVLANSAEQGPRKVTPPTEKTEPISTNKKEEKPKAEKKEKVEGPVLSDSETIVAFTIAGNAKSIMDTTGVSQADAINEAVLEITNGDKESADKYLKQPGIKEAIDKKIKQIKAKTARELEAESPKITISERQLLLDRVKAEIKAALEGRKEGKKEGVEQGKEQAQKTIDALNKKLEDGKITKQELQDRIKELGYNIRWEAGVARLAGEKAGKSMGKKFGEFVGYFKGLKAGRTEQRGLGALVSDYIKDVIDNEFGKKGTISPATLKSIARRAATISNQKQLDAFVSYLDKVIANRRLAEGLNEIKKLQKQLLNKVGYQYTSNMKMFAKFDMFTADGDLAFDMLTMTEYLDALRDLTSDRVPKIGKIMELFDEMYDINQQNQPNDIDIADTIEKWQNSIDKLFNNTTINNFEDYKSFKREVGKYMRALNTLLETETISEAQYESSKNKVIEDSAVVDTYASEFQDQIDDLKKMLIQGITDEGEYGFLDSIKDWLNNSPNTFTENQKKLIDQLKRAKPDNLMTLSLEDLDLLNQAVAQIAEAGFVDEKNLRTLLDRAEIRGNEVGKSLVDQSKKVYNKYSNPKNGYIKMMRDTLGKSAVFWEARLGMKENGAFRKHLVDPIVRAINGWEKDSQRILKDYQRKVEKIRSVNIFKNPSDIKKLVNRTKIEKFKLTTDGKLVPDGTVKVSKDAYDRVMIGVVGHILNNAWNAKQKKKSVNDWLGKQMLSAEERNKMQNEDVNELDVVNNIYNDLKEMFPDGKGGLDHMAVLEAFESDPTSILTSSQLEYYKAAQSALQEAGEYINSASGIRNQQHELTPYYMPRQYIGTKKSALTSTDVNYNKNVGPAIRSGASYQRVLQVPTEAIRYNIDRLVMTNVNEGLRDYYLTEAKRYVNEVFSNARENAKSDEVVMLNNLKQLSDTIAPFALQKSESTFGLSKLMGKFFVDALIGFVRTPVELTTNLISYAIGNRSAKSLTLPFTPKEKQETEKLLSEFDSSVQFTGLLDTKKVKFSGKKGIDGYLDRESNFGLLNKFLNNVTGFMRKGEWKSQFERDFQNNTGEKFNYEKHFVKEKVKYYDEMKRAASDADFRMRRIMKGGNKAEQRQFVEWFPFVKKARISADSAAAPFVGMFSGFVNHDADNLIGGMRKAITRGEIKDGLTQSLGAYGRLALYPVLMVIGKAIANLNLGDDDEKEEAQETLDSLKTPEGWADMALFSAKQVGATLFGGKYAAGGRVVGSLLLDAAYTLFDDRRQKRMIEDTSRELYFVDPIDFYDLPSDKEDLQLQIGANLEPIIGMTVNAAADFINDVKNKGREQVTLYDIYEWTQQTEEGKQWMYMTNSLATLGQTLTVLFTPGAVPFIDDYVRWAEDKLSERKPNENTLYKTPGGEVIDMRDLFLDDSQRIPINISGISTRERDKISILATEKFDKSIEKEGNLIKGLFADDKYLYMEYLFNKAKYEAGVELGFSNEKWDDKEGEMVSTAPIPPSERDNPPESEVIIQKLHEDILKGKQLSFVQNIKEKRKAEDYMFKEFDKNPTLENDYKNATIGGKLGMREYFKAKYLYDKYKLTEPPISSNYFQKGKDGKIKQVESMPQEEN
jgi:hypothetical protein